MTSRIFGFQGFNPDECPFPHFVSEIFSGFDDGAEASTPTACKWCGTIIAYDSALQVYSEFYDVNPDGTITLCGDVDDELSDTEPHSGHVEDVANWGEMEGDSDTIKRINSLLCLTFVMQHDMPGDECLTEAKHIRALWAQHSNMPLTFYALCRAYLMEMFGTKSNDSRIFSCTTKIMTLLTDDAYGKLRFDAQVFPK